MTIFRTESGGVQLRIDTKDIEQHFAAAPVASYFWLRDFLGRSFGQHRRDWLRNSAVKLRGGSQGIRVPQVNAAPIGADDRYVVYRVLPTEQRRADAPINQLAAFAFGTSDVLEAHEEGRTITPKRGRMLAIPITPRGGGGRRRRPPRILRGSLRGRRALILRKTKGGNLVLFERIRTRGGSRVRARRTKTGKVARSQPRTFRDRLLPRYLLTGSIKLRPALNFYDTWDQLQGSRDAIFRRNAERLARDVLNGITT